MVKKVQWSYISNFLSRGGKLLYLLVLAIFIYSTSVQARVCFLPGGLCPGDKAPSNTTGAANPEQRTPQGGDCTGFNLTQIKCKGQACEEGWNCESCTNAQGTFYKCTPKPTPPGYTPGLEKCNTAC
ncbi:MAG: hypothetical protein II830_00210, partial [Alphaproteobacteria bacterium]|nr:hypothetical protein [Alphaproteobacteria bacterium]